MFACEGYLGVFAWPFAELEDVAELKDASEVRPTSAAAEVRATAAAGMAESAQSIFPQRTLQRFFLFTGLKYTMYSVGADALVSSFIGG